ncbi:hypothetical protein SAMN03159341_107323 [Paenibacillus sp. 1_12]|nr:hypothetical protein SAMN03159341_107323 [Paenibacillus sp. 1_12]
MDGFIAGFSLLFLKAIAKTRWRLMEMHIETNEIPDWVNLKAAEIGKYVFGSR